MSRDREDGRPAKGNKRKAHADAVARAMRENLKKRKAKARALGDAADRTAGAGTASASDAVRGGGEDRKGEASGQSGAHTLEG